MPICGFLVHGRPSSPRLGVAATPLGGNCPVIRSSLCSCLSPLCGTLSEWCCISCTILILESQQRVYYYTVIGLCGHPFILFRCRFSMGVYPLRIICRAQISCVIVAHTFLMFCKQWIIPKEIWLSPQLVIRHPSNMNSKEIPPDLYTLNGHISFPAYIFSNMCQAFWLLVLVPEYSVYLVDQSFPFCRVFGEVCNLFYL